MLFLSRINRIYITETNTKANPWVGQCLVVSRWKSFSVVLAVVLCFLNCVFRTAHYHPAARRT